MTEAIWLELRTLLTAALWGMAICLAYDLLRVKRSLMATGAWLVGLEDFFYWLGASLAIFQVLYRTYDGRVRGFVIVSFLLGMVLMRSTGSRWIVPLLERPLGFLGRRIILPMREKICEKCRKVIEKGKKIGYNGKTSGSTQKEKIRKGLSSLRSDKKRKRHRRKASRGEMIGILCVIIAVFAATTYMTRASARQLQELTETRDRVQQELTDAQETTESLEEQRIYVKTKAYVEEVAKELLGLVYEDEVIFKPNQK